MLETAKSNASSAFLSAADAPVRILVVEDSSDYSTLLRHWLERAPCPIFEVSVATHLDSGLRQIEQHPYDVLLVDLSLPDADPEETLMGIQPLATELPTLVLTGSEDRATSEKAFATSIHSVLWKNQLRSQDLLASIRDALESRRRIDSWETSPAWSARLPLSVSVQAREFLRSQRAADWFARTPCFPRNR